MFGSAPPSYHQRFPLCLIVSLPCFPWAQLCGLLRADWEYLPLIVFASVSSDTRHITFEGIPASRLPPKTTLLRSDSWERGAEDESCSVDELSAWLLQRAGVDPEAYRANSLLRRRSACLRQLRVASSAAALQVLERDGRMVSGGLDALLIGVSAFFRDAAVFAVLEQSVLPGLLAASGGGLRVLSAGASTGQELYSVAMLLAERGALATSTLLGLDCRPAAVQQARTGVYETAELESLPVERRVRFLEETAGRRQICAGLRARIDWQVGDVLSHREEQPRDLILFRNVAIYLKRSHADRVWTRLTDQLRPGGVLITGKAESPPSGLGYERIAPCVYRRRES